MCRKKHSKSGNIFPHLAWILHWCSSSPDAYHRRSRIGKAVSNNQQMATSSPALERASGTENEKPREIFTNSKNKEREGLKEMSPSSATVALEEERATQSIAKHTLVNEKKNNLKLETGPEEEIISDACKKIEPSASGKPKAKPKRATRGVIYLSRLPPNIEITSVRMLLSRTGKITNMWLRPETREQQKQRLALGGSRRRTIFRDGWVEYSSRKDARETVQFLNGQPMTGSKRKGRWANDLWCMKFLPGFEWRHLTTEIFGGRERILRVREEMAAARQQRNWVEERSRLSERFRKKGELGGNVEPVRRFLQKRPVPETAFDDDYDDKRAKQAAATVDAELESGKPAPALSEELINLLVKTKKT
ncbi:unnamed protein product [Agarophyton chilense]